MENTNINSAGSENVEVIKKLEERLALLERQLSAKADYGETTVSNIVNASEKDEELELRIGQFWLPKLGIVLFIMGIIFFLTMPFEGLPATLPSIIGYATALIILAAAHFTKDNFQQLKTYFIGGSAAIAFLSTLRLYFFGSEHVLGSWVLEFLGLFFVVSTTLWYAIKNNNSYLTALGIFLAYFTALTIGSSYFLLLAILITSIVSYKIFVKTGWYGLFVFSTIAAFLTHAAWFISNPFYSDNFESAQRPEVNLIFIIAYILVFSAGLLKRNIDSEEFSGILASLLNSSFGYGLFLLITLLNPTEYFALFHLLAAVVCISIGTAFWVKQKSQYSTFIYAMTGYAALSVAIIFQFDQPWNLILLCWQSILVVSTAVWFRSRFIIVANFIIFLMVLAAYLFTYWTLEIEAISFGLAALISARILNWQKDRLELKTEVLRNSYLMTALLWIPYLFYCVLPGAYVGLSLLALALAYFAMGKLINNLKYRWMAVMTLIITVIYLMIFGITNPDIYYKIVSFLAAGIVLIITSAAYNKMSRSIKTGKS